MTLLAEVGTVVAATHVYIFALVILVWLARRRLPSDMGFSRRKFYALMGWVPLGFAALALSHDAHFAIYFFVAGALGIVAELVVSIVWRAFFREPIWRYSYGAVAGGFTSKINFLPWAMGGLLFHLAGRALSSAFDVAPGFPVKAAITYAASLAIGAAVAWPLARFTAARRAELSRAAFTVFCLPIALSAIALAIVCDPTYLVLMATFSVLGFITEYAYGRTMTLFFARPLWTYGPFPIDHGHSSWTTLPLWSIGGMFFYFLSCAVGL